MSKEMDAATVRAWLMTASVEELIDVKGAWDIAYLVKQNEDRVRTVEVEWDGIRVATFPEGQEIQALEYLLSHKDKLAKSEIHIRHRQVRKSELEAELADRWWRK